MYNLFLDDIRVPQDAGNYMTENPEIYRKEKWIIVRSYDEFIAYINEHGLPTLVSYDHDLADVHYDLKTNTDCLSWQEYYALEDKERTGYDCALWLTEYVMKNSLSLPKSIIHSKNMVGKENIEKLFKNYEKHNIR